MSWMTTLKTLLDLKSAYDEVDKIRKYSKKIEGADPAKLKWDDLKFFNNKTMDKATKGVRDALKQSKAAEKATLVWPTCDSLKIFVDAAKAREKYGKDSPQAKKGLEKYRAVLKTYDSDLTALLAGLTKNKAALAAKITKTEAVRDYAGVLEDGFLKCAQIPSLGGTAQNAMFFSLSQDALQFKGVASSLAGSLKRLEKQNNTYISECKTLIKDNKDWITWSNSGKTEPDAALDKNIKSKKPK